MDYSGFWHLDDCLQISACMICCHAVSYHTRVSIVVCACAGSVLLGFYSKRRARDESQRRAHSNGSKCARRCRQHSSFSRDLRNLQQPAGVQRISFISLKQNTCTCTRVFVRCFLGAYEMHCMIICLLLIDSFVSPLLIFVRG
jgi:hypothetical protein